MATTLLVRVLGKYLAEYVKDFSRENLSVSFLKGQGELRDLELNERAINDLMDVPQIKFRRISVNRLRVRAPLTKLTSKPITLFVDRVTVELEEAVDLFYVRARGEAGGEAGAGGEGGAEPEPEPEPEAQPADPTRKYGIGDRIGDGIALEINEVEFRFQTLGKKKSATPGPWRPPPFVIRLQDVRLFSTDRAWREADLEEAWRINRGRRRRAPDVLIHKLVQCQRVDVELGAVPLLVDLPVSLRITLRKARRGCALLSFHIDIRVDHAEIALPRASCAALYHFICGFVYCLYRLDPPQQTAAGAAAPSPGDDAVSFADLTEVLDEAGAAEEKEDQPAAAAAHPRQVVTVGVESVCFRFILSDDCEYRLTARGFEFDWLWPEDYPVTDTICQFTIHHLALHDSAHVGSAALLRPGFAVDQAGPGGGPAFPPMEGRVDDDLASTHQAVRFRMTNTWPPPLPPALGFTLEARTEPLHIVADVAAWTRLLGFVQGCADPRWTSGDWGDECADGHVEELVGSGAFRLNLQLSGVHVYLPDEALCLAVGELSVSSHDALPASFVDDGLAGHLDPKLVGSDFPSSLDDVALARVAPPALPSGVTVTDPLQTRLHLSLVDVSLRTLPAPGVLLVGPLTASVLVALTYEPAVVRRGGGAPGRHARFRHPAARADVDDYALQLVGLDLSVSIDQISVHYNQARWPRLVLGGSLFGSGSGGSGSAAVGEELFLGSGSEEDDDDRAGADDQATTGDDQPGDHDQTDQPPTLLPLSTDHLRVRVFAVARQVSLTYEASEGALGEFARDGRLDASSPLPPPAAEPEADAVLAELLVADVQCVALLEFPLEDRTPPPARADDGEWALLVPRFEPAAAPRCAVVKGRVAGARASIGGDALAELDDLLARVVVAADGRTSVRARGAGLRAQYRPMHVAQLATLLPGAGAGGGGAGVPAVGPVVVEVELRDCALAELAVHQVQLTAEQDDRQLLTLQSEQSLGAAAAAPFSFECSIVRDAASGVAVRHSLAAINGQLSEPELRRLRAAADEGARALEVLASASAATQETDEAEAEAEPEPEPEPLLAELREQLGELHNALREMSATRGQLVGSLRGLEQAWVCAMDAAEERLARARRDADAVHALHFAERAGWLAKQGRRLRNFKRRWFVLRRGLLLYFERPNALEAAGHLPLEGCTVAAAAGEEEAFLFHITDAEQTRTVVLAADSHNERAEWVRAIASAAAARFRRLADGGGGDGAPPASMPPRPWREWGELRAAAAGWTEQRVAGVPAPAEAARRVFDSAKIFDVPNPSRALLAHQQELLQTLLDACWAWGAEGQAVARPFCSGESQGSGSGSGPADDTPARRLQARLGALALAGRVERLQELLDDAQRRVRRAMVRSGGVAVLAAEREADCAAQREALQAQVQAAQGAARRSAASAAELSDKLVAASLMRDELQDTLAATTLHMAAQRRQAEERHERQIEEARRRVSVRAAADSGAGGGSKAEARAIADLANQLAQTVLENDEKLSRERAAREDLEAQVATMRSERERLVARQAELERRAEDVRASMQTELDAVAAAAEEERQRRVAAEAEAQKLRRRLELFQAEADRVVEAAAATPSPSPVPVMSPGSPPVVVSSGSSGGGGSGGSGFAAPLFQPSVRRLDAADLVFFDR